MTDPAVRLVRCPNCRIQVESVDAAPICPACGDSIVFGEATQTFEDDTPERTPTRPNEIIRPGK